MGSFFLFAIIYTPLMEVLNMAFVVVGMIPINKREQSQCAFCNTRKNVKYYLEVKALKNGKRYELHDYLLTKDQCTNEYPVKYCCCNRCVTRLATFVRVDKELPKDASEDFISKEL